LDEPMKSSFYYRIKQVNDNGTFEYSKVVVLQPVERNSEVTAANPFIDYPTLNIQNEEQAQVASIEFIDITGKVIFDQTVTLSYGKNLLAFRELGYLKHGVYFMKVSIGQSEPIVKKIIKSSSN
jgi:hypothetical protein